MKNNQSGQTLLEVLVALSAVLIILTAVTSIVISSLSQSVSSKDYSGATQYAQEGLVSIEQQEHLGTGMYCLAADGSSTVGTCPESQLEKYRREAVIDQSACGDMLKKITVIVSWTDSTCKTAPYCRTVELSSCTADTL